ncbi:type II toxin-antitoxin system PemK/MazF family toxin [Azospirillum rugosum]|uniref:mRNA interferase MazF n=1 Tax=Azospirillum rugosum TaxID=416170 RepID=A0ABS4SM59_9PROT|nr:type II toxin-antitoxin system PemK/MazF family toxin [Azospirillum rugosum]MBP2293168.1 mRNA interferase MazF [Azospirillum rugosum]MDQ0526717.1 mRNA interferase MazF [Azospirillum rugosum]
MIFDRWSVVVVPFPFTDHSTSKRRPALVLSSADFQRTHGHIVCGMITSAAQSDWHSDVMLEAYGDAGLKKPCKFRCKLFTLQDNLVLYGLGTLAPVDQAAVTLAVTDLLPH